jgi:hypothetical protein
LREPVDGHVQEATRAASACVGADEQGVNGPAGEAVCEEAHAGSRETQVHALSPYKDTAVAIHSEPLPSGSSTP